MIEFTDVSKKFLIDEDRARSFQEKMVRALGRSRNGNHAETFWALRDVSFSVERGDAVGIIGANGSGKSTVLKLMSRIIYPTSGQIVVSGRVAALLELGAGFHPDLTGRENVELTASILGLHRAQVRREFGRIVDFSELERFIDVPIRNYSSGMLMRLGFAVATAFQPEILLVDEVLAVGDQAFQDRCIRRIREIQVDGATVILVSHDLGSVQRLCSRAIWIDDGRVCADGPTDSVAAQYLSSLWEQEAEREGAAHRANRNGDSEELAEIAPTDLAKKQIRRWGSGEVRIERAETLSCEGKPAAVFRSGEKFVVRISYHAPQPVSSPAFGISIYEESGNRLNGPNTVWSKAAPASIHGRGTIDYIVEELPLLSGRYDLTVAIYDRLVSHPYDHWHRMTTFTVVPGAREKQDGFVYIPCTWEHRSAESNDHG
jgi:ABC-type polysaccharide/polyol phosphate transport system ATPase subunit